MLSNKVREIMTRDIVTVGITDRISDVMKMMVAKNVGRVVIMDNRVPLGIFTEQDVLRRVMNKKLDLKKVTIKRVMTSPIRSVREEAHIVDVLGKMYRGKFRHMVVCGEKRAMVGLVSMRRILKLAVELGHDSTGTRTIGSMMSTKLVTVDVSQSIYDTIKTMIKKDIHCVVVLSRGELKGIFTERDVLRRVAAKNIDARKTPIKKVMTTDPITMAHSSLIEEVLAQMYNNDFRNVPVMGDQGELAGIVSMGDVLKYAKALDVDENVRKTWKEIKEHWDSVEHYTPG
jgi:CBS domain-containing protein